MTPGTWVLVAVFGAAGALLRHEVMDRAVDALVSLHAVNIVGSTAFGALVGLGPMDGPVFALAAGGLGGLTSFSTWMVGVLDHDRRTLHLLLPLGLTLVGALAGILVGRSLA